MRKFEKPPKVNPLDPIIAKEAYQENMVEIVQRFKECLADVSDLEPSFSNFKAYAIFVIMKQQKEFVLHIKKNGHAYAKEKQERAILDKFIEQAKEKFGKDFDAWIKLIEQAREQMTEHTE